ncbi:MAG: HlyD family efflux transporter periplasmic adaptor subunit, partial [Nanoarchaeota archaeon]|nr:HlyD family efflux transporter periplasmic adaptor subunit [Nanoarchaeota archaeon]
MSAEKKTKRQKIGEKLYHEVVITIIAVLIFSIFVGGVVYYQINHGRVYIESSEISAPIILLKPQNSGILDQVFVRSGDFVSINTIVAKVDGQSIKTKTAGIISYTNNVPGQYVSSQDTIVKMFNPEEFRVIGHIEENKGLVDIKPGQRVVFTVDAFGLKKYEGIVESISPVARRSDIVFSISDKRE